MEPEFVPRRLSPLERKSPRHGFGCKADSAIFQMVAIDPADCDILRHIRFEGESLARFQQARRTQRKAPVADAVLAVKMWPGRTDIVIFQKARVPGRTLD